MNRGWPDFLLECHVVEEVGSAVVLFAVYCSAKWEELLPWDCGFHVTSVWGSLEVSFSTFIHAFIHSFIHIPWILTGLEKPVAIEIIKDNKKSHVNYINTKCT
jgi:hypothetical protein